VYRKVSNVLIILLSLEIRQDCHAAVGIRHDFASSVHKSFIKDLLEYPPDAFHKGRVHGFVRVVEVHPSSESANYVFPLRGIS
jgi:hypothetical protein